MNTTVRVLAAMGAVTLMTYGSALAQQTPSDRPQTPQPSSPSVPPPSQSSAGQSEQTMTATGELVKVDVKEDEITVKTSTGEMTFKYDDETKVTGASRNTAGLATMSGAQVTVRYKKDGRDNLATTIEVKPAAGSGSRPTPGSDPSRPTTPGSDPTRPTSPGDPTRPTRP